MCMYSWLEVFVFLNCFWPPAGFPTIKEDFRRRRHAASYARTTSSKLYTYIYIYIYNTCACVCGWQAIICRTLDRVVPSYAAATVLSPLPARPSRHYPLARVCVCVLYTLAVRYCSRPIRIYTVCIPAGRPTPLRHAGQAVSYIKYYPVVYQM